jgi:hypothetical protein
MIRRRRLRDILVDWLLPITTKYAGAIAYLTAALRILGQTVELNDGAGRAVKVQETRRSTGLTIRRRR